MGTTLFLYSARIKFVLCVYPEIAAAVRNNPYDFTDLFILIKEVIPFDAVSSLFSKRENLICSLGVLSEYSLWAFFLDILSGRQADYSDAPTGD